MYRIEYDCKRPPADADSAAYLLKFRARLHACAEWAPRRQGATSTPCGSADLTLVDLPGMLAAAACPAGLAEATELDWLRDWLLERPGVLSAAARAAGIRDTGKLLVVRCLRIAPERRGKGLGRELLRRAVATLLPQSGSVLLVADSLLHSWKDPERIPATQRLAAYYATLGFVPLASSGQGAPVEAGKIPMVWIPQGAGEESAQASAA